MNQNEKVLQYSSEVPKQIKDLIKSLDSETRLAIIIVLWKKGKMTFTELKNSLDVGQSTLSSDLSLLQNSGLVSNILEWKEKSYSSYSITDLGRSTIRTLFDLVIKVPTIEGEKTLLIEAKSINQDNTSKALEKATQYLLHFRNNRNDQLKGELASFDPTYDFVVVVEKNRRSNQKVTQTATDEPVELLEVTTGT